jgi:hypothetical protein
MWPKQFERRLAAWHSFRQDQANLDLPILLEQINFWWQQSPWCPYHLHWDEQENWPDPWQLLSDNVYCDLARALGIMYTIVLIDRNDLTDSKIIETDRGNLVLIDNEKYILNWGSELVLNTNLEYQKNKNVVDYNNIKHRLL